MKSFYSTICCLFLTIATFSSEGLFANHATIAEEARGLAHPGEMTIFNSILSLSTYHFEEPVLRDDACIYLKHRKLAQLNEEGRFVTLDLSGFKLTGVLPREIGELTSLQKLNLSNNNFQGPLPQTLNNLVELTDLRLTSSNFSGELPSLSNLQKLKLLHLGDNNFSGEHPRSLGTLLNLSCLRFELNNSGSKRQFTGPIPETYECLPISEKISDVFHFKSCRGYSSSLLASDQISHPAGFIDFHQDWKVVWPNIDYILPNERQPNLGLKIWKRVPKNGVYVSVGTERSFIGALASEAEQLLVIDRDVKVVIYVRAIVELLKLARDNKDFYHMRMFPRYLAERIEEAKTDGLDINVKLLENILQHGFWKNVISMSSKNWFWNKKSKIACDLRYWEKPKLFARLKRMALENKIQAEYLDFRSKKLEHLVASIKERRLVVSAIDLSNTHFNAYATHEQIDTAVQAFSQVCHADSLLILTWWFPNKQTAWWNKEEYIAFKIHNADNLPFTLPEGGYYL